MGSKSYSKGISWIDDCRIPFVDENVNFTQTQNQTKNIGSKWGAYHNRGFENEMYKPQGRFPANILVSDDMLNDGVISKSGSNRKNTKYKPLITQTVKLGGGNKDSEPKDKGTNSRYYDIDKWFNNLIDV